MVQGVKKMNIGFIGAGKVGCSFGHYLKQQDLPIVGYYSRSKSSSFYAANLTRSSPLEFDELVKKSHYIFITTPDDVISNIWNQMLKYDLEGKFIFHMSGCLSSNVFKGCKDKNAHCYSLHPLYSFAGKNSSSLRNTIFSIEGENIEKIKPLLQKANINYFVIEEENKPLYHASAVFVSNYIVSLAKIAENLLIKCGLNKSQCVDGIYPLMESTLNNIKESGIDNSLTGPIVRGDIHTVEKHLDNLDEYDEIYKSLGTIALEIAKVQKNLSNDTICELQKILRGDCNEKNCIDI